VLPVLFVVANLAVFVNTLWTQPRQSLIGCAILAAGLPAYLFWKKKS
jgi:hypothetical protein